MSWQKKILFALLFVFIGIQFIHPKRNVNSIVLPFDFERLFYPRPDIKQTLDEACYDCHSNHSRYPWYSSVQPVAWMMAYHIENGKLDLNLSEFGKYTNRMQQGKLQAMVNSIQDNTMPLTSFTLMHPEAKLTQTDRDAFVKWLLTVKDSIRLSALNHD